MNFRFLVGLVIGLFVLGLVRFSAQAKSDQGQGSGSSSNASQNSNRSNSDSSGGNDSSQSQGPSLSTQNLPPQAQSLEVRNVGNNRLEVEVRDESGRQLRLGQTRVETVDIDEEELEVTIGASGDASGSAAVVIRNKLAAQTHFPLMVNLETNELIVTTPKGQKVVTVLPDQAVQHMLAAKVLDQLGGKGGIRWLEQQATPSASPTATPSATPEATPSATPEAIASAEPEAEAETLPVTLTADEDGNLVYEIRGIKFERLLGVLQVALNRVVVSAETGELVEIRQNLLNRFWMFCRCKIIFFFRFVQWVEV